ncbi:STAS domain-containing protein [Streptomyces sp. MA15]|uniref:STAS domain-containing protein n=1 Tax=Streptomyces sp. MA15 TaxID=3055061 RepID=UPI0025B22026|nr:STAS domain-containing protein [Streptomyces sp. MA15]MDN3266141.1 STAS domain-containing protein [Streptomyces sp. MA15]
MNHPHARKDVSTHSDQPPAPHIDVRRAGAGHHLVTVRGALDLHTAHRLADVLRPLTLTDGHTVLLELSGVTFLDSTGLTCLIAAYRTARTAGTRIVLIAPSRPVHRMLTLTGVDQVLHSYPTLEAVPDWPGR